MMLSPLVQAGALQHGTFAIPPLINTAHIGKINEAAARNQLQTESTHAALAPLASPPALDDLRPLQTAIQALIAAGDETARYGKQASALLALVRPALARLFGLAEMLRASAGNLGHAWTTLDITRHLSALGAWL